jgi:hypothetical protein
LLSILIISCLFLSAEKGPQLKFKQETKDFGNVKQGEVLDTVFEFTNAGDTPLLIEKVRTSCGCTAALASEQKIEPGKKGEVKVTFNTRGFGGEVSKYVYVESNDSHKPTTQLTVKASIDVPPRPIIELDSYSQDLGLVLEDEVIKTRVRVKNGGELELRVEFSHKDASFFIDNKEVDPPIKIASGKEKEVDIRIPAENRNSLLREYILFRSNDPMRPNLSLYLTGYVLTKQQLKELFEKYKDVLK